MPITKTDTKSHFTVNVAHESRLGMVIKVKERLDNVIMWKLFKKQLLIDEWIKCEKSFGLSNF